MMPLYGTIRTDSEFPAPTWMETQFSCIFQYLPSIPCTSSTTTWGSTATA